MKHAFLRIASLGVVALLACPANNDPPPEDASTGDASTSSTGPASTSEAMAPCADSPVVLDSYFQGFITHETRLINELTVTEDCAWSFKFTDCEDVEESNGTFAIEGETLVLTSGGAFTFIDGAQASQVTLSQDSSCDSLTVDYENEDGPTTDSWSRGVACLSGPSCCMDCTMVPPIPQLEYCDAAPEDC